MVYADRPTAVPFLVGFLEGLEFGDFYSVRVLSDSMCLTTLSTNVLTLGQTETEVRKYSGMI